MVGSRSSLRASIGALAAPSRLAGGVGGRVSEKAASATDARPATVKMLESAAFRSAPILPARMNTNGQLAAIHPMVPHSRKRPKSRCASATWWKQIALVSDIVGM